VEVLSTHAPVATNARRWVGRWRTLRQPVYALPLEPSARIFERQRVHRLLSRHIPRFLWTRICRVGCFSAETKVYLTYGDLLSRSILIEGFKIPGRLPGILPDAWSGIDDACMGLRSRPHIPRSALGEENQGRIKPSVISVATIRTWASVSPFTGCSIIFTSTPLISYRTIPRARCENG